MLSKNIGEQMTNKGISHEIELLNGFPVADVVNYMKMMERRHLSPTASQEDKDILLNELLRAHRLKKREYVAAAKRHERKLQALRALAPKPTVSCFKR